MKKFLAPFLLVGLCVALLSVPALAGSVALFTGPTGANPANNAADQADMNALVNALNSAIGPGVSGGSTGLFTSGSVGGTFQSPGFLQSTSFGANLGTGESLTTGTLVPYQSFGQSSGTSIRAKFFLTFIDSQGIQSFIPVWQ